MKHLYKVCLASAVVFVGLLFINASTGPGQNFGNGYTNAPFDGGYCNGCHGGGTFTPSVSIQLMNGTTPVSNYIPGSGYTLHISVSSSTGVTPNTAYGFQVVGVRSSNNLNAGSWGSLALTDYHSVAINGRTYVEHNMPLSSGSIDIPWTAPGGGNGPVTFYAAGNVVNQDGSSAGDNPTATSYTVPVNPLAATWVSFEGKYEPGKVMLQWMTTSETNAGTFILDKSSDGRSYSEIYRVNAQKSDATQVSYHYTDLKPSPSNYYRIRYVDLKGVEDVFKTIQVRSSPENKATLRMKDDCIIVNIYSEVMQTAEAVVFSINGKMEDAEVFNLQSGNNSLKLNRPSPAGLYLIHIRSGNTLLYSGKIMVE